MQQLQLNNRTLLLVPVPEGAYWIELRPMFELHPLSQDYVLDWFTRDDKIEEIDLPPGNWQFIATTEALTEEQAAGLVESKDCWFKDYQAIIYGAEEFGYTMALDSFRSFLSAHNITGNHAILI